MFQSEANEPRGGRRLQRLSMALAALVLAPATMTATASSTSALTTTAGGSGTTSVVAHATYWYYNPYATLGVYPRLCADSLQPQRAGSEVWVLDTQTGVWKYWGFQSVDLNNVWNSTPRCWTLKYEASPPPGVYSVYVRYWWLTGQTWRYADENKGLWRV
jgi:hypothetical protein